MPQDKGSNQVLGILYWHHARFKSVHADEMIGSRYLFERQCIFSLALLITLMGGFLYGEPDIYTESEEVLKVAEAAGKA